MGKSHEIPQIDPWQTTVTERLGISDEIYAQGSILAVHWVGAIDALTDLKKADLLSTLEASAHAMPELPQDHNGRVLPRIEYAAKHIVYETHERGDVIQDLLEGSAKRVTPDFNQMETVLGELMEAYDNNMPPYNYPDTMTPQDQRNMPKTPFTDDRQKANFFLTSCLWMRRMNSVTAMQNLGRLFDATRDWEKDPFDPHVAADMSEDEIEAMLEPYPQLQMRTFTVPAWIHNAQHLVAHFDGDARNIIADTDSYTIIAEQMVNKIPRNDRLNKKTTAPNAGFEGFQKKMVSMFLYYMIDSGLKDYFDFPLPVDIHVARIGMGTEMVKFEGFAEESNHMIPVLLDVLRDMLYDYSLTTGRSQMDVCNAIWLLGASSCSSSPETQTKSIMLNGRSSELDWYEPDYSPGSNDLKRLIQTCGSCAIADYCEWVARGKENQLHGTMTPRRRRTPETLNEYALFPIAELRANVQRPAQTFKT